MTSMKLDLSFSLFEFVSSIGFAVAIATLWQGHQTRRAEFSLRIWDAFMRDEVQAAYLEIEWSKFKYPASGANGFRSDEHERAIDRLLYLLDEMALMIESGILTKGDQLRWSYQGKTVFADEGIKAYLKVLDGMSDVKLVETHSHAAGRRVFGDLQAPPTRFNLGRLTRKLYRKRT